MYTIHHAIHCNMDFAAAFPRAQSTVRINWQQNSGKPLIQCDDIFLWQVIDVLVDTVWF